MLRELDKFLSYYPNIINACIALGTIGAVIVSLIASHNANKPNLSGKISCRIKCERNLNEEIIEEDSNEYIVLDLRNNSGILVYLTGLNSFNFAFPFAKTGLLIGPLEPRCTFHAVCLEPFSSKIFILTTKATMKEQLQEYCREYKYPKILVRFLNFFVYTSTSYKFKMKIDEDLITQLTKNL